MERCYRIREGYLPIRDDVLPDRLFEETICNKYNEPKVLDHDEFMKTKEEKYLSFELNNQGIPPKESLEKLGMEFVIPELEEIIGRWD